ncbi:MAG: hypothetical protein KC434_16015, partial [Anaerolineales bacterium]|nr:hypothetical protein [Anaerolineales bacterium]
MRQQSPTKANIIKLRQPHKHPKRKRPLPVTLRLVLGLALLIGVGTAVLLLPGLTTQPITFSDALFTATSAASVTGLTVLTTSTDFTFAGQIALLCLIQLGGVGYMVLVALALQLVGRRVSLLDRLAISTSLGLDKPAAILRLLRQVVIGIFIIEGVGALLLFLHWRMSGIVAADQAAFYAIFHVVSAFCNAGFDLFVGLPQYPRGIPGDNVTLLIMGSLIVLGGLGIPVFVDFSQLRRRKRLTSHTHLTLSMVVVLTLAGWIGLFVAETQAGGVLETAPLSERLVRTTRRLATRLNAEWIAAYVETPAHKSLSPADRERVTRNLQLAESLGAQAVRLNGRSVAETLVNYALNRNVTRIVAGKPLRPRWKELLQGGSLIDQIVRQSQDLDVYIISSKTAPEPRPVATTKIRTAAIAWGAYGRGTMLVVAA